MALLDTYNFDMKEDFTAKGIFRNLATAAGAGYNGAGTPYTIYFMGTTII
ncbi:hypothetical protein ACFQZF_08800 [Flavobacterium myungsuense]|uniref:Uncharacterized protein n=1 Tax=Flavobacterium myungsuense TaxID=651823 RepID=A0ABW3IYW3_9FLAO